MLDYSQIKERTFIDIDGTPYEVLSHHVFRKQQRKPVNQTKLKNLITGKVTERSFHQNEKVSIADLSIKKVTFLYENKGEFWFCDENDAKNRFILSNDIVGPNSKFIKQNSVVDGLVYNNAIIGLKLPLKVILKVKEAPPGVKGDSAQGAQKQVILETGAMVNTPLFINEGDLVEIKMETGEYTGRVEKS